MANDKLSKCIVVLGMHRSGTSALTRVISLLGCDLPKTLMGANHGNETGHWESLEMMYLNDAILESAGSFWNDWTACPANWFESPLTETFIERANDVFDNEFGNSRFMVLKDPRICRIYPFWEKFLKEKSIEPRVIFPLRNPVEVAQSLTKRDGSDLHYGMLLWLRYVLDAELFSRQTPRVFTHYNELLENWSLVASKIENGLGIKWPRMSVKVCNEIDEYLSTKYRHNEVKDNVVLQNKLTHDWIKDTYRILKQWCVDGENKQDYEALDKIRDALNHSTNLFSGLISNSIKNQSEVERLSHEKHSVTNQLEEIRSNQSAKDECIQRLEQEYSEKNNELELKQNDLEKLNGQYEALNAEIAQVSDENVVLKAVISQSEETISNLSVEIAQVSDENSALKAVISQSEEAISILKDELTIATSELKQTEDELKIANDEIHFSESALKQKSAEIDDMQSEIEKAAQIIAEQEIKQNESLEKINDLTSDNNRLSTENANLRREIENIKESLLKSEHGKQKIINRLIQIQGLLDDSQVKLEVTNQSRLGLIEQITHEERPYFSLKRSSTKRKANLLRNAGVVDEEWYLKEYPDVAETGMNPTLHYVIHGKKEGRKPRGI